MSDNIHVAIRLRPLIPREIRNNDDVHWYAKDAVNICQMNAPSTAFCFDRVFDTNEGNEVVYKNLCCPVVQSVMKGFNGTIFAYGQTSTGKTYTMMGDDGIVPNAINDIFNAINNMPEREFLVRVSYMEIYNEFVADLLAPVSKNLKIQEDTEGLVSVVGLKEVEIKTSDEVFDIMQMGERRRHFGDTQMNERSSRSHAIFRMIVESRMRNTGDDADTVVSVAHLNLVDLSGSEKSGQMGITGEKFREGTNINKSLLMLTRVISQLSEGDRQFVSYRDSKLTRILQNSLGGNANTVIICTVTPASLDQTHSTLKFASRAKRIKNKPTANIVTSDKALLKRYTNEIRTLSEKLVLLQQQGNNEKKETLEKELQEKNKQNEELKDQIQRLKEKFIVSQLNTEPVNVHKKVRRETVCFGSLKHKSRIRNPPDASKSFFSPLPVLQEEVHIPNSPTMGELAEFDAIVARKSCSISPWSPLSLSLDKTFVDSSSQTEEIFLEQQELKKKLKKIMCELSSASFQNEQLKRELYELKEFTVLEKDFILEERNNNAQAMKVLQEECQALCNNLDNTVKENALLCSKIKELELSIENLNLQLERRSFVCSSAVSKSSNLEYQSSDVTQDNIVGEPSSCMNVLDDDRVFNSLSVCNIAATELDSKLKGTASEYRDFGECNDSKNLAHSISDRNDQLLETNNVIVNTTTTLAESSIISDLEIADKCTDAVEKTGEENGAIHELVVKELRELKSIFSDINLFADELLLEDVDDPVIDIESSITQSFHMQHENMKQEYQYATEVYKNDLATKEEQIMHLTVSYEKVVDELKVKTDFLKKLENEISMKDDKYLELQTLMLEQCQKHLKDVEENEILKQQMVKMCYMIEEKEQSFDAVCKRLCNYKLKLDSLQNKVSLIKHSLVVKGESFKLEKYALERNIEFLHADKSTLTKQNEELRNEIMSIRKGYDAEIEGYLEKFKLDLSSVKNELRTYFEMEISIMERSLRKKHEMELQNMEDELKVQLKMQEDHFELDKLKIEEKALCLRDTYEKEIMSTITGLKSSLHEKEAECNELFNKLKTTEKSAYSNKITASIDSSFASRVNVIKDLKEQLSEQSKQLRAQKVAYEQACEKFREEIRGLEEEKSEASKKKDEIIQDLHEQVEEQAKIISSNKQEHKQVCDLFHKRKKELEEKVSDLKEQYKNIADNGNNATLERLKELTIKNVHLANVVKEKETTLQEEILKVTSYKNKIHAMEAKISYVKTQRDSAIEKVKMLEKEKSAFEATTSITNQSLLPPVYKLKDILVNYREVPPSSSIPERNEIPYMPPSQAKLETGELCQRVKKLEEERNLLQEKLSASKTELRRYQQRLNESKVEPKRLQQISENKADYEVPPAGSGVVNAYWQGVYEPLLRQKDKKIEKMERELEKFYSHLSKRKHLKTKSYSKTNGENDIPKETVKPKLPVVTDKPKQSTSEQNAVDVQKSLCHLQQQHEDAQANSNLDLDVEACRQQ